MKTEIHCERCGCFIKDKDLDDEESYAFCDECLEKETREQEKEREADWRNAVNPIERRTP